MKDMYDNYEMEFSCHLILLENAEMFLFWRNVVLALFFMNTYVSVFEQGFF